MAICQRIVVVGSSGAGKTTTACLIAARLGLPHVELDALHWDANWNEAPLPVFRARVAQALAGDAWVVDGNYGKARDLIWPRAELVVWLDYPLRLILWRLVKRSLRRSLKRETLWNDNRESLRSQFFSRDSLLLWALKTYARRRAEIPALLNRPEHRQIVLVQLRSPAAQRHWLARLPPRENVR